MMKSKPSQNKLMRLVTMPKRALGKAKDFYVRSMISCAEERGRRRSTTTYYGGNTGAALPKSFSARCSDSGDCGGDDYSDLVRAASVRSMGHLNEIDMLLKQRLRMMNNNNSNNKASFPKSCSAGMAAGFMGVIEEENPGDLADDGSVRAKASDDSSSYPRSRSVAVAS